MKITAKSWVYAHVSDVCVECGQDIRLTEARAWVHVDTEVRACGSVTSIVARPDGAAQ